MSSATRRPDDRIGLLEPGRRLGAYEIRARIGAGGMGEVYRATDTRLRRDVALKILPPDVADAERLERFRREAQAVAALNHPGIVTVHSIEEGEGIHFLTMELVDGQSLDATIPSGGIPVAAWLATATALADAIGAAHGSGIVHRDLKPGNVMVATDGRIKVLDFGLAKLQTGYGDVATATARPITQRGSILGTIAYMSPEQAEGREVDHRTDIFSLGVMLYEMATGRRPFTGDTNVSVLAAIVKDTPAPATSIRPELPAALDRILRRCLAKDPGRRFQSAIDLRNELDDVNMEIAARSSSTSSSANLALATRQLSRLRWAVAAIVIAFGAFAGYAMWPAAGDTGTPSPILRLTVQPPPETSLPAQSAAGIIAISPNGRWVAFEATSASDAAQIGLYLRATDQLEPRLIRATPRTTPFFSTDSQWLGFQANGALWKVSVSGGQPERLCAVEHELRGASWSASGIVFAQSGSGLWRLTDAGQCVALPKPDPNSIFTFPNVLPGGKAALVMTPQQIAVVSLETGARIRTLFAGHSPRYVAVDGGLLLFRRLDVLYAVAFDLDRLEPSGEPRPIQNEIAYNGGGSETSGYDVGESGDLLYLPQRRQQIPGQLVWLDRTGRVDVIDQLAQDYGPQALDPAGSRVAVHIAKAGDVDLWVYDVRTKEWRQLTHGGQTDGGILWTPDGRSVIYTSRRAGMPMLFRVSADGGEPVQLTEVAEYGSYKTAYDYVSSVHGNTLMFSRQISGSDFDLLTRPLEPARTPAVKWLATPDRETDGQFSPDGRWVAYTSQNDAVRKVELRAYADPMRDRVVVAPNGFSPRWSRDGRTIFYVSAGAIWAVAVTSNGATGPISIGAPRKALDVAQIDGVFQLQNIELIGAGEKFLTVKRPREALTQRMLVYIPHWIDHVRSVLRTR